MHPLIRSIPGDTRNRLAEFGITPELLLDVVSAMVLARRSCTENHPPSAAGWMSWSEGVRRLRELTIPLGWESNDDRNISLAVNKAGGVRVSVVNCDEDTGKEKGSPQNRAAKGRATKYSVSQNQDLMESILDEADGEAIAAGGLPLWYLMVYCDKDEVRAEFSHPISCTDGFFDGYSERIILDTSSLSSRPTQIPIVPIEPDEEIDIAVTRKAQ